MTAAAETIEGRTFGSYRIRRRMGAGGIGAVYEAEHTRTGRLYAVKVLLPEAMLEPTALRRFRREAEALANLGHASIVAVHDFDITEDGVAYLVMDKLEGEDLGARLERGPLRLDAALDVFEQVADALERAHDQGILHRDLKPSNVFLAHRPGATDRAVLLDFGLAKFIGDAAGDASKLTATGATMGTPMYMSPEQAQGFEVDVRTDVYSLGTILFECLTARPPFEGPTLTAILSKVLTHPPPSVCFFDPELPEALDDVLRATMAKSPDERPATVSAFRLRVARATAGAVADRPAPALPPPTAVAGRVTPPGEAKQVPPTTTPRSGQAVTPLEAVSGVQRRPGARAPWIGLVVMLSLAIVVVVGAAWWRFAGPGAEATPGGPEVEPTTPVVVAGESESVAPEAPETPEAEPPTETSAPVEPGEAPVRPTMRRAPSSMRTEAEASATEPEASEQPRASMSPRSRATPRLRDLDALLLRVPSARRRDVRPALERSLRRIEEALAGRETLTRIRRAMGRAPAVPAFCTQAIPLNDLRSMDRLRARAGDLADAQRDYCVVTRGVHAFGEQSLRLRRLRDMLDQVRGQLVEAGGHAELVAQIRELDRGWREAPPPCDSALPGRIARAARGDGIPEALRDVDDRVEDLCDALGWDDVPSKRRALEGRIQDIDEELSEMLDAERAHVRSLVG